VAQKTKNSPRSRQNLLLIGIILAAVVLAVIAIVVSSADTGLGGVAINYDEIPQNRTDDGAFVLGNPDAEVRFVIFEDFLCPACQQYEPTVRQMINDFVATGRAQVEFRMLLAVDPTFSPIAFGLAECAEVLEPGSFWEARDMLFEIASARRFDNESPRTFADRMNIPYGELLECQADANQWQTDTNFAQQYQQVRGTPTVALRINDGALQFSPLLSGRPGTSEFEQIVQAAAVQ